MRLLGDKVKARSVAEEVGVPVVPGAAVGSGPDDRLAEAASALGLPLLVKAVSGGGGRGMRRVDDLATLADAVLAARHEGGGQLRRRARLRGTQTGARAPRRDPAAAG